MKTTVIFCIGLFILIALGGLNGLVAAERSSSTRAHTWLEESARIQGPTPTSYQDLDNFLPFISFLNIPLIYVGFLQTHDVVLQKQQEALIKNYQEKKMMEQTEISEDIREKLSKIDSLISDGKYKESLKELTLLENQIDIEEQSLSAGYYFHLYAVILYFLGSYQDAVIKGEKALALLKDTTQNRLIAESEYILGRIFLSLGNLKSAELHLRDSITSYRRIDDQKKSNKYLQHSSKNLFSQIGFSKSS